MQYILFIWSFVCRFCQTEFVCIDAVMSDAVHGVETLFEPRCEKTGLLGSDQVPHKPGCTATEDG